MNCWILGPQVRYSEGLSPYLTPRAQLTWKHSQPIHPCRHPSIPADIPPSLDGEQNQISPWGRLSGFLTTEMTGDVDQEKFLDADNLCHAPRQEFHSLKQILAEIFGWIQILTLRGILPLLPLPLTAHHGLGLCGLRFQPEPWPDVPTFITRGHSFGNQNVSYSLNDLIETS